MTGCNMFTIPRYFHFLDQSYNVCLPPNEKDAIFIVRTERSWASLSPPQVRSFLGRKWLLAKTSLSGFTISRTDFSKGTSDNMNFSVTLQMFYHFPYDSFKGNFGLSPDYNTKILVGLPSLWYRQHCTHCTIRTYVHVRLYGTVRINASRLIGHLIEWPYS